MSPQGKLWFRRKTVGWGWTPVSIEGWLSLGAYLGGLLLFAPQRDNHPVAFYICVGVATMALIALCLIKGEAPQWQWGRRR